MSEPTVHQQIEMLRERFATLRARASTPEQHTELNLAALSINTARDFSSLPDLARLFLNDAARELDTAERLIIGGSLC